MLTRQVSRSSPANFVARGHGLEEPRRLSYLAVPENVWQIGIPDFEFNEAQSMSAGLMCAAAENESPRTII